MRATSAQRVLDGDCDLTGSRPFSAAASSALEELSPCVVATASGGLERGAPENHSLICSWRARLPFCWRRLQRLCQQYATIFVDATSIVVEAGVQCMLPGTFERRRRPRKHVSFWSKMV
jgi:hypothetical protein